MRDAIRQRLRQSAPAADPSATAIGALPATLAARLGQQSLAPAAVLVPLIDRPAGLHLLLTRRTEHLRDHAGQISFPGGRVETLDNSLRDTALREAAEEVGMPPDQVEIVGYLAPHAVVTGFVITPVVGIISGDPALVADPTEVAEIFEAPLAFFLDPANRLEGQRTWHGVSFSVPEFQVGQHRVWGATAQIINTLLDIIDN
ncbi:MAG: CoA pyrophosphatase [Gammaproteobacteria bacterium]